MKRSAFLLVALASAGRVALAAGGPKDPRRSSSRFTSARARRRPWRSSSAKTIGRS